MGSQITLTTLSHCVEDKALYTTVAVVESVGEVVQTQTGGELKNLMQEHCGFTIFR